jgi:hypothetical protein
VSNAGYESDKLWQLIEEQKRAATVEESRARLDLYSHDAKQTWIQAVFASLRTEKRRSAGRAAARKRLQDAISLSERAGRAITSRPVRTRRRVAAAAPWSRIAIYLAVFVVLALALAIVFALSR